MTALSTVQPSVSARTGAVHVALRWLVSFVGFPAGAVAARLIAGPVDDVPAALIGGLVSGAVLGTVQSWALGRGRPPAGPWIAATATGLMVGLGIGATAVDFDTTTSALVVQGAVCGLGVGTAQAVVLRHRLRAMALAWPPVLGLLWAAGWAITTSVGVRVDEQFTVFGSSGAVFVTVLTAILPFALTRQGRSA
jgi:hypothetical protein